MAVVSILIFSILVLAVPLLAGGIFDGIYTGKGQIGFRWVSGQLLLWTGFLIICVPLILLEKSFVLTVRLFDAYTAAVLFLSVVLMMKRKKTAKDRGENASDTGKKSRKKAEKGTLALWITAVGLLVLQLVLAGVLAYEEGDDAFYVAISTITEDANTMYRKLPYTGGETLLDARHGLAPFPIWVAYLAWLSGIPSVTVAQVVLPMSLIGMAYCVYLLLGARLTEKHGERSLPFFMILVELLVIFGGYSLYSAENFLLVRTAQGKAVLANIILPFLLFLFLLLLEKLEKEELQGKFFWLLFFCTMAAGCLCSTLGTVLTCMLTVILGLCVAFCYPKGKKVLLPLAGGCILPGFLVLLYVVIDRIL